MKTCCYCSAEMAQDHVYCPNCGQYRSRREAVEARAQIALPFYREAVQQSEEMSRSRIATREDQQA